MCVYARFCVCMCVCVVSMTLITAMVLCTRYEDSLTSVSAMGNTSRLIFESNSHSADMSVLNAWI